MSALKGCPLWRGHFIIKNLTFLYFSYKILHFCILLFYPIMNISAFGDKKLKKPKKADFLKKQMARSFCAPVKNVS